jgi:hypothetical protein
MPEPFDDMRAALHADADQLRWADPAQVRHRGTQRGHRRLAVGGLVTALVIGGGVGVGAALIDNDDPTPPPPIASPSPSPTPPSPSSTPPSGSPSGSPSSSPSAEPSKPAEPTVAVPDAALLQPSDAGPGFRARGGQGLEDGTLGWLFDAVCQAQGWGTARDHTIGYGNQTVIAYPDRDESWAWQIATRFKAGKATAHMGELRDTITRCSVMKLDGSGEFRVTLLASRFAGQDSILVRLERVGGEPSIEHHMFIRQGDLLTEIGFERDVTVPFARAVAEKAAKRLCNATPTC